MIPLSVNPVARLAFSPDGALLFAVPQSSGEFALWDLRTRERLNVSSPARVFGFHPSLPQLVGMVTDSDFGWFDPASKSFVTFCCVGSWWPTPGKSGPASFWKPDRAVLTPDGGRVLASCTTYRFEIALFDPAAGPVWLVELGPPNASSSVGFALLPDDLFAVVEDFHNPRTNLSVRSLLTGERLSAARLPCKTVTAFAASPDGTAAAVVADSRLIVHDLRNLSAAPRVVAKDNPKGFTGVAFHPSGRFVAAASNDKAVYLYDAATWRLARILTWAVGRVRCVAFSPNGALAAAGGERGTVVWDVDV